MGGKEQNRYAEILLSCIEEKYFKDEIALEHHSFARIISGEMKVVQADRSYLFGPGDTMLFPCNQLSTLIKNPKNGLPYKAIVIFFRPERLKDFYSRNPPQFTQVDNYQIKTYKKHPLLESFFASLIPYFDLESELPEKIISVKIEEAITILSALDPNIDNVLADFSQAEKINLVDFMERNYMFNMNMERFGRMTGRSLTTFKRDFKKAFNNTPQKWLIQKRLELAHHQLSNEGRKPIEVYLETGFENLSHFSFAFKKYFGYPPTSQKKEADQ
ncbi:helix-turn-helix domain-containing protein [Pedobacter metabolipauper]|uniref:AraC-like DNA-binding protein n=1 Tax=Pedobacter metabolipauper TaxID=425513 RepID=A0A4R6T002_9SPHI|nr:AraC family transcriptional regulator [Pedobacter metabolipauper]TDQ10352.1 AraC-like DNA-binding protein [Pedobacter metabolipauper]